MDKNDRPTAFGVFKPVGHIVIAFLSADDMNLAAMALGQAGVDDADMVRYAPDEMKWQVEADLGAASGLASIGQELNLVKAHLALAQAGCSFLVVHAPDDGMAKRVADIARQQHAVAAQHYGHFIIEELIASPRGDRQVFESPARGLDLHVPGQVR